MHVKYFKNDLKIRFISDQKIKKLKMIDQNDQKNDHKMIKNDQK